MQQIERLRPQHIVVTLVGGTQERLGLYLKRHLSYLPSIHCVGAAIALLSGDQVYIPVWANQFYLGWFFRSASEPKRYIPRYWDARKLFRLMVRYRDRLPELAAESQSTARFRADRYAPRAGQGQGQGLSGGRRPTVPLEAVGGGNTG